MRRYWALLLAVLIAAPPAGCGSGVAHDNNATAEDIKSLGPLPKRSKKKMAKLKGDRTVFTKKTMLGSEKSISPH